MYEIKGNMIYRVISKQEIYFSIVLVLILVYTTIFVVYGPTDGNILNPKSHYKAFKNFIKYIKNVIKYQINRIKED